MENNPTIADASWTDLREAKLDTFSTTAAIVISDPVSYPDMVTEAALLTSNSSNYHIAFSRFEQFGGTANKDAKDAAKSLLYKTHYEVARKLENTYTDNIDYLTRPGYSLDRKPGGQSNAAVPPPVLQKVDSRKVRGVVDFILKAKNTREIKGVVGRYSLDNGVTWIEDIYVYRLKFRLENQASGATVVYQFRFMATGNRVSYWSDKIYVDVF